VAAFVIPLSDLDRASVDLAGGKAANLGELLRAGLPVPDGFCLTTEAFERFLQACPAVDEHFERLNRLDCDDRTAVNQAGAELRNLLLGLSMPEPVLSSLLDAWHRLGDGQPCAVRSSATAEDRLEASFAGQHDTFLNVANEAELIDSVRRCWISLFTDRAIVYRARQGFDHRRVALAVVVQRMVEPQAAGVMFTADPINGHRHTVVINASYGLGDAVVSGLVNPDLYRVDKFGTLHKSISDKPLAIRSLAAGGVAQQDVPALEREAQALPDEQILELVAMGRRIRDHFGAPQDIEWAWADGRILVLQSRPITTLYPTPASPTDRRLHVYFSFGHQQMMTDAITPLGRSVLRTYFPFGKRRPDGESTQLVPAGGRLFFDYTDPLHTRLGRRLLAKAAGAMDERVGAAVLDVANRPEFGVSQQFDPLRTLRINAFVGRVLARVAIDLCLANTRTRLARTETFLEGMLATSRARIDGGHGADRIARIQEDLKTFPMRMFFRLNVTQLTAIAARGLLEGLSRRWLANSGDLGGLHMSLPGNVTTEMGLAIGDLADLARGNAQLLALLQSPPDPFSLSAFDAVPGGPAFRDAFHDFLDRYGMRAAGEVDLTRTRWNEQPAQLFPGILANARQGRPGEHRERFLAGTRAADATITHLLDELRATRFGRVKAMVMSRLVRVYRTMLGLREHPKFHSVRHFDLYRRAIRAEAGPLVDAGILAAVSDVDYLSLDELSRLLRGQVIDGLSDIIKGRQAEHDAWSTLTAPRLFTSDGEVVTGGRIPHAREGVLVGSAVSGGIAEGRARVVLRPQDAELHDGDILVAPSTDPAWTPLFSAVRGIVLEIGGVMSHGAVVARELGIPTVVGIDNATRLIPDGARIRVDGSAGLVEPVRD